MPTDWDEWRRRVDIDFADFQDEDERRLWMDRLTPVERRLVATAWAQTTRHIWDENRWVRVDATPAERASHRRALTLSLQRVSGCPDRVHDARRGTESAVWVVSHAMTRAQEDIDRDDS
jgi:hypothetical protein